MNAIQPFAFDGAVSVVFAEDQPEYDPLPALLYPDGHVLIEWSFTDEERALIARGENLRHWVLKPATIKCAHCGQDNPCHLQPVALQVTSERIA